MRFLAGYCNQLIIIFFKTVTFLAQSILTHIPQPYLYISLFHFYLRIYYIVSLSLNFWIYIYADGFRKICQIRQKKVAFPACVYLIQFLYYTLLFFDCFDERVCTIQYYSYSIWCFMTSFALEQKKTRK